MLKPSDDFYIGPLLGKPSKKSKYGMHVSCGSVRAHIPGAYQGQLVYVDLASRKVSVRRTSPAERRKRDSAPPSRGVMRSAHPLRANGGGLGTADSQIRFAAGVEMVRVDLALSEVGGPVISYYDIVRDVARNAGMRFLIQRPQIWRAPLR
jgi:hypothetical protein